MRSEIGQEKRRESSKKMENNSLFFFYRRGQRKEIYSYNVSTNEKETHRNTRDKEENKGVNRTRKRKNLGETLQTNKVEILAIALPFLHLLLLFSGARLELHSNASLSIPVTPGNTVP